MSRVTKGHGRPARHDPTTSNRGCVPRDIIPRFVVRTQPEVVLKHHADQNYQEVLQFHSQRHRINWR